MGYCAEIPFIVLEYGKYHFLLTSWTTVIKRIYSAVYQEPAVFLGTTRWKEGRH